MSSATRFLRGSGLIALVVVAWLAIAPSADAAGSCLWSASLNRSPSYLYAVGARTSRDVWAVGPSSGSRTPFVGQPRIEHWNGSRWRRVDAPRFGEGSTMSDVAVVSRQDVWAVGSARRRAVFLHWDGTAWREAASPAGMAGMGSAWSVAGLAGDDVWAIGGRRTPTGWVARVWHWDGTSWDRVRLGGQLRDRELADIEVQGERVTAMGNDAATGRAFILRLDAHRDELLLPDVEGMRLDDRDRGVAVGRADDGDTSGPLVLQRTEGTWDVATLPDLPPLTDLAAVAVVHPDDAFVFGSYPADPADPDHSDLVWLAIHWDGSAWSQVADAGAVVGASGQPLQAAVAPTSHEVWVAGQLGWKGAVVRGC